jgi:peptidoglycan/LPS O-acetylase OafA/YrhL
LLFGLASAGGAALAWDFRMRIALALTVAIGLGVARSRLSTERLTSSPKPALSRWIRRGARSSYALFLTHFSILMLANALWVYLGWASDGAVLFVGFGAWCVCLMLAMVFERFIERPLSSVRL